MDSRQLSHIISEIEKNMPADLSGLKVGDTILEINEKNF